MALTVSCEGGALVDRSTNSRIDFDKSDLNLVQMGDEVTVTFESEAGVTATWCYRIDMGQRSGPLALESKYTDNDDWHIEGTVQVYVRG